VQRVLGDEWRWQRRGNGGFVTTSRREALAHSGGSAAMSLARYVAKAEPGQVVRHRDGNPLNVMLNNLELITPQESMMRARKARAKAARRH
jgi:hypothetical protein